MAEAKSLSQKIAFSPLTFQALRACLKFKILQIIDDAGTKGVGILEIEKASGKNSYTVSTLIEVLAAADIIIFKDGKCFPTKVGQMFLYDEMTKVNFDFVNDVCYRGAFYLTESFERGKPEGLKVFGNWPTVYEGLAQLPEQVKRSWFAFDHFYSDNAFNDVIKIILDKNPKNVCDVGANTGKFELAMFSKKYGGTVTLCDLPQQLAKAKENLAAAGCVKNCVFYPIDVLDKKSGFKGCPSPDAVLMSQFLDCFSKEEIISILKKASEIMTPHTSLYILEPFWDEQKFDAAKLSLTHTSLYFTAIANGCSKMYASSEMKECVEKAGLKVTKTHKNIGAHEYTLLEAAGN
jgi:hypothetical protein